VNDSAVQVLGDETLRLIARELVETVRNNASIDWMLRERARIYVVWCGVYCASMAIRRISKRRPR